MHIKIVHLWPDCIFIISSCQQLRLCQPQLLGFVVLHTHTQALTHTCRHLYSTQLLRFSNKSHAWIVNISTCALGTNERQLQLQLAPAALIEALHANIHEQLHQVCLQYNIYIYAYVYLADTGLSADICMYLHLCSNHCSHLCATFALAILRFQHFAHFLCVTSLLLLLIQWGNKHK